MSGDIFTDLEAAAVVAVKHAVTIQERDTATAVELVTLASGVAMLIQAFSEFAKADPVAGMQLMSSLGNAIRETQNGIQSALASRVADRIVHKATGKGAEK